jgi:hypothetical protein
VRGRAAGAVCPDCAAGASGCRMRRRVKQRSGLDGCAGAAGGRFGAYRVWAARGDHGGAAAGHLARCALDGGLGRRAAAAGGARASDRALRPSCSRRPGRQDPQNSHFVKPQSFTQARSPSDPSARCPTPTSSRDRATPPSPVRRGTPGSHFLAQAWRRAAFASTRSSAETSRRSSRRSVQPSRRRSSPTRPPQSRAAPRAAVWSTSSEVPRPPRRRCSQARPAAARRARGSDPALARANPAPVRSRGGGGCLERPCDGRGALAESTAPPAVCDPRPARPA